MTTGYNMPDGCSDSDIPDAEEMSEEQKEQLLFLEAYAEKMKILVKEIQENEPDGLWKFGESASRCVLDIAEGADIMEYIGE